MKGKEVLDLFYSDYKGEELAEKVEDFVNNYTFDQSGFVEEIKTREDKEKILPILLFWILKLKIINDCKRYDLRNEYSVIIGKKIYKILHNEINDMYNKTSKSIREGVCFIEAMSKAHRTLQQSFSGLIFESLLCFPELKEKLLIELDEDFYKTPLI